MRTLTQAQRKSLLLRVNTSLLDEVIQTVFLSAQAYDDDIAKGKATKTQFEAMEDIKRNIKQLLNN